MATKVPVRLSGLARRLVTDQLITEEEAVSAQETSLKQRIPFVTYVVGNNIADASAVVAAASAEFGVPVFDV